LADYKKITTKMEKAVSRAKGMNLDHVEHILSGLQALQGKFKETSQSLQGGLIDGHVRPIVDWALTFAELAENSIKLVQLKHELDEVKDTLAQSQLNLSRVAFLKQNAAEVNFT